jgi:hypothetical protein
VLFLLLLAAGRLPALALGACVIAVVAAVAVIDRIQHPNQAEA